MRLATVFKRQSLFIFDETNLEALSRLNYDDFLARLSHTLISDRFDRKARGSILFLTAQSFPVNVSRIFSHLEIIQFYDIAFLPSHAICAVSIPGA